MFATTGGAHWDLMSPKPEHDVDDPTNGERDLRARIHPAFIGCWLFGLPPSSRYVSIAR